ncbi:MAG: FG-GAP repeat protein, partial [candidate division WOR-3 bacterium]
MRYKLLITIIGLLMACHIQAEETYNLEILFRCTAWDSWPNLSSYGIALAGGDVNGDGYSDIAVEADHYVESLEYFGIDIYVFYGGPAMDSVYDVVLRCPEHFGHSPSGLWIGDVNGDSIGDVVVGDHGGSGGYGEVWVFFGGSPLDTVPDLHLVGMSYGRFGGVIAGGDVNGDGCDDIIVGAREYDGSSLDGRVYVFYGGNLLDSIPDIIINGHDDEAMGASVGSGGDLNSDGYEDIVIGADENHEAYWWAGKVYVFFGGDPMDTVPDCWLHGEGVNHKLGWFGCDIMEVNNDHDMMITGTSMYPNGFPSYNPGKVYVLYGGDPMDTLPDLWMIGQGDTSLLGRRSRSAGDVNGDGFEDALVGAPLDADTYGTGYLWLGGMPMDTVVDAYLRGGYGGQNIGWYVAPAGDVDGDGR